jgi:hypothetical protein
VYGIGQTDEASTTAAVTSLATTGAKVITAHSTIVAFVATDDDMVHSAPTDTLGNAYSLVASGLETPGTEAKLSIWIAHDSPAGANDVSVNVGITSARLAIAYAEITGLEQSAAALVGGAVLGQNTGSTGANVITAGPIANPLAPGMVLGIAWDLQSTINNPGSGYTSAFTGWLFGGATASMRVEHRAMPGFGSNLVTFEDTNFSRHLAGIVVLLEAGASAVGSGGGLGDDRFRHRPSVLWSGSATAASTKRNAWPDDAMDRGLRDAIADNFSRLN